MMLSSIRAPSLWPCLAAPEHRCVLPLPPRLLAWSIFYALRTPYLRYSSKWQGAWVYARKPMTWECLTLPSSPSSSPTIRASWLYESASASGSLLRTVFERVRRWLKPRAG